MITESTLHASTRRLTSPPTAPLPAARQPTKLLNGFAIDVHAALYGMLVDAAARDGEVVTDALSIAWFRSRPEAGVIVHGDRCSQY